MNKNILMISPSYFPIVGGTETYISESAKALREEGYIVNILSTNMNKKWYIKPKMELKKEKDHMIYRWGGINPLSSLQSLVTGSGEINKFKNNAISSLLFNIHFIPLQLKLLNKLIKNYEILIFHDVADYSFPKFIRTTKDQKKIFICHTLNEMFSPKKIYLRIIKQMFRSFADKFVVVAKPEVRLLNEIGIPKNKIKFIPIGVDTNKYSPRNIEKVKNTAIFIGRCIEKRKGFHILLRAMKQIKSNIELTVVDFRPSKLAGLNEITGNKIIFIGKIDQDRLIKEISKNEVLILPSLAESFGIVGIEALACGTPVISSDLPSVRPFLNEKNSIKFKVGDIKGLSLAIDRFFNLNSKEKEKMANFGRKLIFSKFSWKIISKQLITLFN
ncbi:MAG: glycosyltransferase family 4 protein [Candidatus Hodarchaeota archaeon]